MLLPRIPTLAALALLGGCTPCALAGQQCPPPASIPFRGEPLCDEPVRPRFQPLREGPREALDVRLVNELSDTFAIKSARLSLDEEVVYCTLGGDLPRGTELGVLRDTVAPGEHELALVVRIKGNESRGFVVEREVTEKLTVTRRTALRVTAVIEENRDADGRIGPMPQVRFAGSDAERPAQ